MASKVEICNLALNHIGQRPISSLDENSQSARACNLIYENLRDAVLRANAWNFATVQEKLALISNESVPLWDFLYAQPSKCLSIRKIFNESKGNDELPDEFQVMLSPNSKQKCIATNIELAWIEYTYQVSDTLLFDGNFTDALSYRMAASLAQTISGNAQMAASLMQIYKQVVDEAKLSNAREGMPIRNNYSGLIGSR